MISSAHAVRGIALVVVLTGLALSALAALSVRGSPVTPSSVVQASDITLGVDVVTSGNGASSLGPIDACTRVEVDAAFDIDVFITDVTGLRAWELYLAYDPSLLEITAQDFLMVTGFDASDPVPGTDGSQFLGVGAATQHDGSGVLARVTMHAKAAGSSVVEISHNPAWPRLNAGSDPIGDTNGDGAFDGPLIPARVAIGEDCSGGPIVTQSPGPTGTLPWTPSPTPSPTPTPTPTPVPTPSPTPAPPMRGDANCNGLIDIGDIIDTLAGVVGVPSTAPCPNRGDANCNGILDPDDVLRLLRFVILNTIAPPQSCQQVGDPIP
jgi:hypothetical protein